MQIQIELNNLKRNTAKSKILSRAIQKQTGYFIYDDNDVLLSILLSKHPKRRAKQYCISHQLLIDDKKHVKNMIEGLSKQYGISIH